MRVGYFPRMKPTDVIALAAVIVAGLAIIVGAAVQVALAVISAGRDRRRRRYDELMRLYAEIGEAMSAYTDMASAGFARGKRSSRRKLLDALENEADRHPAFRRMQHLGRSLRLQDANMLVWTAYQDFINYDDSGSAALASGAQTDPDEFLEHLDALLRWFYKVAGDDARAELKLWPNRAKFTAMRERHRALDQGQEPASQDGFEAHGGR